MEQLDYDFFLFRELQSGQDSMLERVPGGPIRLQQVRPTAEEGSYGLSTVERDARSAPSLTIEAAVEHLTASGGRCLFFADSSSGHGCVIYRRYDGHYGLITLAE